MRYTHTGQQTSKSLARRLFAGYFGLFSASISKIILDTQISEYNNQLSTTPNTYDTSQDKKYITPTAPQFTNFRNNHSLSLVPRNYRHTLITKYTSSSHSYPQSPFSHIVVHQPNVDDRYEQIIEQPHTTNFRSQNNHIFSP